MDQPIWNVPEDLAPIWRMIDIPFPSRISSDIERSRRRHLDWIAHSRLWPDEEAEKRYRAADFPQFVARVYPWAEGDDLDLATDAIGWSFLWDDSFDEQGDVETTTELISHYRDTLYGRGRAVDIPLVSAWREIVDRLNERTSPAWQERHEIHWEEAFDSFCQEARYNHERTIPTVSQYMWMRRVAGGTDITLDWVEAAGGYELPNRLHMSHYILTMRQQENAVVALTNDLFSARKEHAVHNSDNIVHVLAKAFDCSWATAAQQAVRLVHDAVDAFREAERALLRSGLYDQLSVRDRAVTIDFIEAMKHWMRGSLEWHLGSDRYDLGNPSHAAPP